MPTDDMSERDLSTLAQVSESQASLVSGPARRKLFLHIGSHKTGTTSIQHNLAHNTEALAAHGLSYFYESRIPVDEPPPDLHSWLGFVDRERIAPSGMTVRDPDLLVELLDATRGDVIVSAENFSFFFGEQQIRELYSLLTLVFSDIDVVCYLRRQDRHVISHHQEGSKPLRRAENELFGHSGLAIPAWTPDHDLYLDYQRRLTTWADVFGRDALRIRVFDRTRLHGGDAVADFFNLLGVPTFTQIPDRNASVGRYRTKVGHLLNATPLVHHDLVSKVVRHRVEDGERARPSRQEAKDYYERFRASNAALQEWALPPGEVLFDDDFDEYDLQPFDRWDEDSANGVMTTLLEAMDALISRADDQMVRRLRDTALDIGAEEPDVALALLRMAQEMRPDGRLIQRRLKEFEDLVQSPRIDGGADPNSPPDESFLA